jgi:hypothetical protein
LQYLQIENDNDDFFTKLTFQRGKYVNSLKIIKIERKTWNLIIIKQDLNIFEIWYEISDEAKFKCHHAEFDVVQLREEYCTILF